MARNVLRSINVTIIFHVLDVLALLVAGGGVDVLTHVGIIILFITVVIPIVVLVLSILVTGVTGLAHLLLLLLNKLGSGFEVCLKINQVLPIVIVATATGVVGTKTEDNEAFGGEELSISVAAVFLSGKFLDELTLLEFNRVVGQVDVSISIIISSVEGTHGLGSTDEFGSVGRGGVVGANFGGKGVGCLLGGGVAGCGEERDEGELHDG